MDQSAAFPYELTPYQCTQHLGATFGRRQKLLALGTEPALILSLSGLLRWCRLTGEALSVIASGAPRTALYRSFRAPLLTQSARRRTSLRSKLLTVGQPWSTRKLPFFELLEHVGRDKRPIQKLKRRLLQTAQVKALTARAANNHLRI